MDNIIIKRVCSTDKGTFGVLIKNDMPICVTCELPWKNNQAKISCIPEGAYRCKPHTSPKYPDVWEVCGVPDRDAILIHMGNTINDIEGCILVGQSFGILANLPAVLSSKLAFQRLKEVLPNEFTLIIKE